MNLRAGLTTATAATLLTLTACAPNPTTTTHHLSPTPNTTTTINPTPTPPPGLGATRTAWDATHTPAPGFPHGRAYGPLTHGTPRYLGVMSTADTTPAHHSNDDRITAYTLTMPPNTSPEDRIKLALAELPHDTHLTVHGHAPGCQVWIANSPTLNTLFPGHRASLTLTTSSNNTVQTVSYAITPTHTPLYCGGDPDTYTLSHPPADTTHQPTLIDPHGVQHNP